MPIFGRSARGAGGRYEAVLRALEDSASGRAGGSRGLRLVLGGAPGGAGGIAQPTQLVLGADATTLMGWGGRAIKKTGA